MEGTHMLANAKLKRQQALQLQMHAIGVGGEQELLTG